MYVSHVKERLSETFPGAPIDRKIKYLPSSSKMGNYLDYEYILRHTVEHVKPVVFQHYRI